MYIEHGIHDATHARTHARRRVDYDFNILGYGVSVAEAPRKSFWKGLRKWYAEYLIISYGAVAEFSTCGWFGFTYMYTYKCGFMRSASDGSKKTQRQNHFHIVLIKKLSLRAVKYAGVACC